MRKKQQRQQRPGSAPPAPSLERAPRADVAAGIGRGRQPHHHRRTASPHRPSVDRALAAGAPAEEANSPLWSSPDEVFQRVTARDDFFPIGWVERGAAGSGAAGGGELPPAPVRSAAGSAASAAPSSSARSRLLFPELNGSRLLVIDRHPFGGDAPLLLPVTSGATAAAAALLGAGMLLATAAAAAAAAAAARRRGRGRRREGPAAASPPSSSSAAAAPPSRPPSDGRDADALLRLRGEAAAARLRSRFAGALDGGDPSGGGSLGRDDEDDEDGGGGGGGGSDGDESGESRKKRDREAERAWRSFFSKSKMHLVDEDAWSREKKNE